MTRAVRHSSASDSHLTPANIVEAARTVLGRINLDPASSEFANRLVRADRIFTREDDGLVQPWVGRILLNPPGGALKQPVCGTRSSQALWWGRLASSWTAGDVEAAIFVCFSLELLQSAQNLVPAVPQPLDFPVCVPRSRIKFDHERDGQRVSGDQPTHGNLVVGLGVDRAAFKEAFENLGVCY